MHIFQLLDCLVVVPHIEVVVSPLPETFISRPLKSSRCLLFQNLNHHRKASFRRLTDQQMNVLRHEHISSHNKPVAQPHLFQFFLEDSIPGSI